MFVKKDEIAIKEIINYDNFSVECAYFKSNPETIYETAKRKKCVIMIPYKGEKIVMVDEYRISVRKWLLQLPAGKIEAFETAEGAAKRELYEETGFSFCDIKYLGSFYSSPHFSDEEIFVFAGEVQGGENSNQTPRERINVKLICKSEVENMISSNKLKDAKTITAYLMWRNSKWKK